MSPLSEGEAVEALAVPNPTRLRLTTTVAKVVASFEMMLIFIVFLSYDPKQVFGGRLDRMHTVLVDCPMMVVGQLRADVARVDYAIGSVSPSN
jgi:hypothetical protein